MKTKNLHDFYSWHCVRDEVVISGKDEYGKDFTIVFDTIELLEWLDLPHMKDQAIKHIQEIGKEDLEIKNFLARQEKMRLIDEEEERSECCGAEFQPDSDLCPDCKEHTGREI